MSQYFSHWPASHWEPFPLLCTKQLNWVPRSLSSPIAASSGHGIWQALLTPLLMNWGVRVLQCYHALWSPWTPRNGLHSQQEQVDNFLHSLLSCILINLMGTCMNEVATWSCDLTNFLPSPWCQKNVDWALAPFPREGPAYTRFNRAPTPATW